jgi:hypothetical protein
MPATAAAPPAAPVAAGDPCCPPLDGATAMPVVYESGQTPPCPPGP